MPLFIRPSAEPLSEQSFGTGPEAAVIVAQSDASRVLSQELERYCRQQIQGRSFLIAGHRGAGKTTAVADVLLRMIKLSTDRHQKLLRPLPVLLHGPSMFMPLPSDRGAYTGKRVDAAVLAGSLGSDSPATIAGVGEPAVHLSPTLSDGRKPSICKSPSLNDTTAHEDDSSAEVWEIEGQAEVALKEVMLGLHRATVREFVRAYRRHLLTPESTFTSSVESREYRRSLSDRAELAAQFEIEILEDPPASRLREFWEHAGALEHGVLNTTADYDGGGARELVALNGICNAHQRVSGDLSGNDKETKGAVLSSERSSGYDLKTVDALKPIAAVLSGAAVAGGATAATHSLWAGALLGGLSAIASSSFMRQANTVNTKRGRTVDTIFIPDLTLRTLDRILPTLLERLRDAGLAPVFVIDELDKIDCLSERIVAMVHYFKKLFAETVFTCFITDRGYLEYLRVQGRHSAYSVAYSYFSHPLLIAFEPSDMDRYLSELLIAAPESAIPGAASGKADSGSAASLDLEVLKWVLRHRSQMHALDLMRELMSVRGEGGKIDIPEGLVRTSTLYKLDATFQVAIELELTTSQIVGWKAQRPGMRQTLLDALYYVSRKWLRGDTAVNLGADGEADLEDYLRLRMNLSEVVNDRVGRPGNGGDPAGAPGNADAVLGSAPTDKVLTEDDLIMLKNATRDVARFLCGTADSAAIEAAWPRQQSQRASSGLPARPEQSVLDSLLLGKDSALYREEGDDELYFRFRYYPSGARRDQRDTAIRSPQMLSRQAQPIIDSLRALEASAWTALRRKSDPALPDGAVFQLLADDARVLPTTPAWSQVRRSIQSLEQARHGVGNTSELDDDLRVLTQFNAMLSSEWHRVEPVLMTGAFLGGVQGATDTAEAARFGLKLLSAALDFAATRAEAVLSRVSEVRRSLESISGVTFPPSPALTLLPIGEDSYKRIEMARGAGAQFAGKVDWPLIERDAWADLERRLSQPSEADVGPTPSAGALLCAASVRGPGALLPLNLRPNTLRDCTRLLSASLSKPEPSSSTGHPVPLGVLIYALRRLGIASFDANEAMQLSAVIVSLRGNSADESVRLVEQSLGEPSRRTDMLPPQLAFVVAKSPDSAALQWVNTPTRGVVLVATEVDPITTLEPIATLFAWWTSIVTIVWEPRRTRRSKKDIETLRRLIPKNSLILETEDTSAGKPRIVFSAAADGADQLLIALGAIVQSMNKVIPLGGNR